MSIRLYALLRSSFTNIAALWSCFWGEHDREQINGTVERSVRWQASGHDFAKHICKLVVRLRNVHLFLGLRVLKAKGAPAT